MNCSLTIICPVYNEEEVIKEFYDELKGVLIQLCGYESKILFVVDRCTDTTLDILKGIADSDKTVQIIALSSRFGHQMALLAGIDNSSSDVIIMMDADLQHPPSLIPRMLEFFEKGYEIVHTVREYPPEIGFFKRLSSKLFYKVINRISDVPIHEGSADFRLISRRVADVFRNNIRERNQFMRGLFSWVGFKSIHIPFQGMIRRGGESKYSIGRLIRFGIHGIISFSRKPLQAAVIVGIILASLGILYSTIVFIQYFVDETLPSGWATLTILLSFFSGIQLIFLGIIGEYIAAIFDEVKGRPHYIIEEKINI
ncbi:MAG: glycosyltransferase family 2 protein [Candidatus Nitrosocaldus sp.]